jgi:hypothetical protein
MSRMRNISSMLVNPLGFSNGWAALALSGPPPLVPSSLMASWPAKGPPGTTWVARSTVATSVKPWKFWMAPWLTRSRAPTKESGRRTRMVARVRSTQKLPMVADRRRMRPRTRATATAIPTAAETKFCTARPTIWVRWLTVFSAA